MLFIFFNDHDRNKFDELYAVHKKTMLYIAMGILYNNELAEDAVHNAFERVLKNLHKIENISSHKTKKFMVVITRNVAIDMYHKLKSTETTPIDNLYDLHNEDSKVENILVASETINELKKELQKMPIIYIDAFDLKHNYDFSNKEIAELLNITEPTLRKRLQVIRDRLRAVMEENNNGR